MACHKVARIVQWPSIMAFCMICLVELAIGLENGHEIYDSVFSGKCPLFLNQQPIHSLVILVCFYIWPWLCWQVKFPQRNILWALALVENDLKMRPPEFFQSLFAHETSLIQRQFFLIPLWIWAGPVSCFDQKDTVKAMLCDFWARALRGLEYCYVISSG